jgi:signal transduction histidine kinase
MRRLPDYARAVLDWLRTRVDPALAGVLAAAALAQAAVAPIASTPVAVAIALLTTLPLLARRTHPAAAALVSTAAGLIPSHGFVYVGYVVAFVVFYSAAVYLDERRRLLAVVSAGVALAIAGSAIHDAVFGDYFAALSAVIAPAVVGRVVRFQRAQALRLAELTRQLEAERELNVMRALADERRRIARELHDVVAHTISAIGIQADAADAALAGSPEVVHTALGSIRHAAADALVEMRRLLAVLREDDELQSRDPQPSLTALPDLLERTRKLGIDVALESDGEERPLPESVDLAAYRIVQEALTNVRKHAEGAPTTVRLDWRPQTLAIEILNVGDPVDAQGSGHGLIGMRERARIHGGTFDARPAPRGGFLVRAELPYEDGA